MGWKSTILIVANVLSSDISASMFAAVMCRMNRQCLLRLWSFVFVLLSGVYPCAPNGIRNGGIAFVDCHNSSGGRLVCEWGVQLYLCVASSTAISHNCGDSREWANAALAAFIIVRFHLSAIEFCSGWCGMVVVCSVPFVLRNMLTFPLRNSLALSV